MKKVIPILFVFFLFYSLDNKEEILIPNDAIRLRIIANSNTFEDQELKIKVKENIETKLNELMLNSKNSKEAEENIKNNLSSIREEVNKITLDNEVLYGNNYFPEKEYHGIKYEEGNYNSLVIKLGSATGNNWWCVMFPPLCIIDAKNNNTEKVEYKLFVKEILSKYQA